MSGHETPAARSGRMLKESGYKLGGDVTAPMVKRVVRKAAQEDATQFHGGEVPLNRRRGGAVDGDAPAGRPDRRARGGAMKHKGKPNTKINIMVGGGGQEAQQAKQEGLQAGVQIGARAAAAKLAGGAGGPPMPPHPPMAPPMGAAPGAPPPGMMPPHPPMGPPGIPPQGVKDGGKVKMQPFKRRSAGGCA